jgi:hypothetical protein
MGIISINSLAAGMILAADIHDRNGRLLIRAGSELTDKNIYVLRTWGVINVDIAGLEEDEDCCVLAGVYDSDLLASAEAYLKPLFKYANLTQPGMSELFRLCILRRAQHVNS